MNRNMLFTGPNAEANAENLERIENESTKRLGLDFNNELNWKFNFKQKEGNDYTYSTLSFGQREIIGSLLSPDMTTLILFGNKSFLGEQKDLAYSNLQQLRYSSLGYRQAWVSTRKGNRKTFEIGFKLLQGSNYVSSTIEKADLFTDSLGESMSGEFKGEYFSSGSNTAFHHAGMGAAVDIRYQTTLSGNAAVSFSLRDFGVIRFNESTLFSVDSTIDYQGIVVDPNTEDALTFDIRNEFLDEEDTRMIVAVPYTFQIKLHYQFSAKDLVEIGIESRNIGAYVQKFSASYARFLGNSGKYFLISGLDVGGFGRYYWQEQFMAQVSPKMAMLIGVGGIEGLVFNGLPMNSYLNFALSYKL